MKETCRPFRVDLSPYLDGELDTHTSAVLAAHLETCAACATTLEQLRGVDRLVRAAHRAGATADADEEAALEGALARIGAEPRPDWARRRAHDAAPGRGARFWPAFTVAPAFRWGGALAAAAALVFAFTVWGPELRPGRQSTTRKVPTRSDVERSLTSPAQRQSKENVLAEGSRTAPPPRKTARRSTRDLAAASPAHVGETREIAGSTVAQAPSPPAQDELIVGGFPSEEAKTEALSSARAAPSMELPAPARQSGISGGARIVGTVTNRSGTPIRANVIVLGTKRGVAADADGRFEIENVRPGTYDMRAIMPGYSAETRSVQVEPNKTTEVAFSLPERTTEMEGVEITGTRHGLVRIKASESSDAAARSELKSLPGETLREAIAIKPGIVAQSGQLHVRGGRGGEIKYQVDGRTITDPLAGIQPDRVSRADSLEPPDLRIRLLRTETALRVATDPDLTSSARAREWARIGDLWGALAQRSNSPFAWQHALEAYAQARRADPSAAGLDSLRVWRARAGARTE